MERPNRLDEKYKKDWYKVKYINDLEEYCTMLEKMNEQLLLDIKNRKVGVKTTI